MPKLFLTTTEKKALKEFKNKLLQELGGEILALRLFGSKTRRDFKKISDIDIFILLKKTSLKKEDLIFEIATDISLKYNIDLSPKIFSKKEYEERLNLQIPFFLSVEKEGVSL